MPAAGCTGARPSTGDGRFYSFDNVKLNFAVYRPDPPIYLGVEGPKMLTLSGEIADGTVLSVLASPDYVEWAWERVREGCAISGRDPEQAQDGGLCHLRHGRRRRRAPRMRCARPLPNISAPADARPRFRSTAACRMRRWWRWAASTAKGRFPTELVTDEIVKGCSIAGTPDECKASIQAMIDAGADEIVFIPFPPEKTEESVERIAKELIPVFR